MWSATGSLHLPGNCQGATESGNIRSSQTLWENGDHCGGNRGLGYRFGQLAKILKGACASGGTVKGRIIELQGDHKKKVAKVLEQNGYKVEVR